MVSNTLRQWSNGPCHLSEQAYTHTFTHFLRVFILFVSFQYWFFQESVFFKLTVTCRSPAHTHFCLRHIVCNRIISVVIKCSSVRLMSANKAHWLACAWSLKRDNVMCVSEIQHLLFTIYTDFSFYSLCSSRSLGVQAPKLSLAG